MPLTGMSWLVKPLVVTNLLSQPVPEVGAEHMIQLNEFKLPIRATKQIAIDLPAPGNIWLMVRPEQTWGINLKRPQIAAMWAPTQKSYFGFSVGVEPKDKQAHAGLTAAYYTPRTQITFGARSTYQDGFNTQVGIKAHFIR